MRNYPLTLLAAAVVTLWLGCSGGPGISPGQSHDLSSESLTRFVVENWFGTWVGEQPDYPLRNADGEIIVVQGKEAKVSGSRFEFRLESNGQAFLNQSHADGRVADFAGTWKGQIIPETNELVAVVCDLSAVSTGAYRQYALVADSTKRSVVCIGTSREPVFDVEFQ